MLKSKNSLASNQNLKSEVYYRIVPMTVKLTSQLIEPTAKWLLYLQKGMQIIGKTDTFEIASPQGEYTFESSLNTNANKFDFQIVALQKNSSSNTELQREAIPQKFFTYTWSLYSLDSEDMEERIVAENFSIRDHYQKYLKESAREGYDLTANLKYFTLSFKLFIQNTSANITELVNGVIPENQDDVAKALVGLGKKGDGQFKDRNRISSMISMERERDREKQRQVRSAVVEKAPEQTPPSRELKKVSLKIQPDQPQPQPEPEPQPEPQPQPPKQPLKYPILEGSKIDQVQSQTSSLATDSRRRIESRGDSLNLNIDQGDAKLEAIYEDREREDLVTPHANDLRAGSFNQAIAEIVVGDGDGDQPTGLQFKKQKEEGNYEDGNQNRQQITEPPVYESSSPTPDPQQEEPKPKPSPQRKPKTPEALPELSLTPTDTGMKFKKLIIVFLFLVLIAGIVGTALTSGGKVKDLEEEEEEKPTPVKGKKKGKKTKGKL